MIIKYHLQIPESSNSVIEARAREARLQNIKDLCDGYGFPSALMFHDTVEIDPQKCVLETPLASRLDREKEIQLAVGGLALELKDLERYWNGKTPYKLLWNDL